MQNEGNPFDALDALEQLAGPPPEQPLYLPGNPQQAVNTQLLKEARRLVTTPGSKPTLDARQVLHDTQPTGPAAFGAVEAPPPTPAAALAAAIPAAPLPPPAPPAAVATVGAPAPPAPSACTVGGQPYAYSQVAAPPQYDSTGVLGLSGPVGAPSPPPPPAPAEGSETIQNAGAGLGVSMMAAPAPPPPPPPPAQHVAAATDISNWDSDDEAQPGQEQVERADFDAPTVPAPPPTAAQSFAPDACGAPVPPPMAVLRASPQHKSEVDELDDLVGDILATCDSQQVRHSFVDGFHCTGCDFQILSIQDHVWTSDVDYMFFRNNYPTLQKLQKKLESSRRSCAYCCQCSWRSADSAVDLADVAEGLRWRRVNY